MVFSADVKAETIAKSRAVLENTSKGKKGFLRVQLHPWQIDRHPWAEGIIRAFDPFCVLLPNRKVENFRSAGEVAEVWVRFKRSILEVTRRPSNDGK